MKKSRIFFAGLLGLGLVFGLVLTGCSDGGGSTSKSNKASVTSISIAGVDATIANPVTKSDWLEEATATAELPNGTIGQVIIAQAGTLTDAAVAITASLGASAKYAGGTTIPAPESFQSSGAITLSPIGYLFVQVTSEDGGTVNYYVVKISLQDSLTTLASLTIGGVDADTGIPNADISKVTPGAVLIGTVQPTYAIVATPSASTAIVSWGKGTDTPPAAYGTDASIAFVDGEFLYVKVVAVNGDTAYYKVQVNLMQSGTIKYGVVEIKPSADKYIDPKWDDPSLETYSIAKVATESTDGYKANPTTTGLAKALFDETGLYLYVVVTDPKLDFQNSDDYLKDSVELFINEAVDGTGNLIKSPVGYSDKGGQYRVTGNGRISGDPVAAVSAINPAKVSAWDTPTGYVVIFQAPWRFLDQYPLAQGKKIGFELQINNAVDGNRNAVVVWNNVAHTNYQNVSDYGEATLDANGHNFAINAKNPTISVQPAGKLYQPGTQAVPLTVTAASTDGGTLSYEWFSNTTNSYTGGTSVGTGAFYTPVISIGDSTTYYWVEVTNTITVGAGDGGEKTKTLQSAKATVRVSSVPLVEKIVASGSSVPVYGFTLPEGDHWSDYTKWTFSVLVADQATLDHTAARGTIAGNYTTSVFGATGVYTLTDWGSQRIVDILAGQAAPALKTYLGDPALLAWTTKEIDIPATGGLVPAANATGPFYFGLGFTVNQNSGSGSVSYYIKDVALSNADGSKLVPADDLVQFWCQFSTSGTVTRTLEVEPTEPVTPPDPKPPVDDYPVDLANKTVKNAQAWTANYQGFVIPIDLPSDFAYASYTKLIVKVKIYDAEGAEQIPNYDIYKGQALLIKDATGSWSGDNVLLPAQYNLGPGGISTTGVGIELTDIPGALIVQNSAVETAFIEVTEITFVGNK
jgi:hypothetical protein